MTQVPLTKVATSPAARGRKPRKKAIRLLAPTTQMENIVLGALGILGFFAIWEIGHLTTAEESRRFLPSPIEVMATLVRLFAEESFAVDVWVSFSRIVLSFAVASAVAIPLGILMGSFGRIRALLNPALSGARYLPAASFIPLLLVWFGPTDAQKLALLFLGVVFFLIAMILDNTEAVPTELVEASMTMGASRREVVLGVIAKAAAPAILDSMRTMIAVGWTYLVIAEIVAASDGIGAVMMRAGRFLKVDVIMAGILMIGVLGVATDIMFRLASRWFFPWNRKRRT